MDLDSIFFIRTPAGETSLANPGITMSPSFRRMLQLLDGTRSLADLQPLFPQLDAEDMRLWISELMRQRMIKRAPTLTRSQRLRMRANTPEKELQVQQLAEQIRPWLAGKDLEITGPRQKMRLQQTAQLTQLARTARLAAVEASTAATSIGRSGFFVNPETRVLPRDAPSLILVVEDDQIQAQLLGKFLEKDGHQVRLALNGAQALAALNEQPAPQMLLLDVDLPDTDGFAILEQVRAAPNLQHLRVIMVTGHTDRANIAKGVLLGADGYITKPFQPGMLQQAVRQLLAAEP